MINEFNVINTLFQLRVLCITNVEDVKEKDPPKIFTGTKYKLH